MIVQDQVAPPYERLRPLKPLRTATFPVYDGLSERLASAEDHPDPTVAHVLATCAGYAYSDAETVTTIMARLGLEDNVCRAVAQNVDAMLIASTAYLVQSADGRVVILGYRGTVPTSAISWLNDLDVCAQPVPLRFPDGDQRYEVHGGFYRNVRATRHEVIRGLERALAGACVLADGPPRPHPMEALYLTGQRGASPTSAASTAIATGAGSPAPTRARSSGRPSACSRTR